MTFASAGECEQHGCCWNLVTSVCYYRGIYDRDICHAKRHASHPGVCRFVGTRGYVVSAWYPFYSCARRVCGDYNALSALEYPAGTTTDFVRQVFHWRNVDSVQNPADPAVAQVANLWRIGDGGNQHPCFTLRTTETCTAKCDLDKQIAGPDQEYECRWDTATSSMRLKGLGTVPYKGGTCIATPQPGQTLGNPAAEPVYPCPTPLPGGATPVDCTCCIIGLCTSANHDELNLPQVIAPRCGSLKRQLAEENPPNSGSGVWIVSAITSANQCDARCASGWREKYSRAPVYYHCPFYDYERGADKINGDQIQIPVEKTRYEGSTWQNQNSLGPGISGGVDLIQAERIIQCITEHCEQFSNADVETARTKPDQMMALYDTSACSLTAVSYTVEDSSTCVVQCGQGYEGLGVTFRCVGVNDPVSSPTDPPKAKFRGVNPADNSVSEAKKPSCSPNKCTLYSSMETPLPSPGARYQKLSPTIKDGAQTGGSAVKCSDLTTDSECTLQCLPGYTPLNTMAYTCMNRRYDDGRGFEVPYSFVPKEWFNEVVSKFPTKISKDTLLGLKCPAQMCKYTSLPTSASHAPPNSFGPGLSLSDCYGRVSGESCQLHCSPGYTPNALMTANHDTLSCDSATLDFSQPPGGSGNTFTCTPQACTSGFPITTIAGTCGWRLQLYLPCPCTASGGTVPGCLGVDKSPCDGKIVGEDCIPECFHEGIGFSRSFVKVLECTGQSNGFFPETEVGRILWKQKKPIYKEDQGLTGKVCTNPTSVYGSDSNFGFRYGVNNLQIRNWVAKAGGQGGWRLEKDEPVDSTTGLDGMTSNANSLRTEECWRFCDHLREQGKPCVGVSVVEGMYCIPIPDRAQCGMPSVCSADNGCAPMLKQGTSITALDFKGYFRQYPDGTPITEGEETKTTTNCVALPCMHITENDSISTPPQFHHDFMQDPTKPYDPVMHDLTGCDGFVATERCPLGCQVGYEKDPTEAVSEYLCQPHNARFTPSWGAGNIFPTCLVKVCDVFGRPDLDLATGLQITGTESNCLGTEYRNQCQAKCTQGYRYEVHPWPNPKFIQAEPFLIPDYGSFFLDSMVLRKSAITYEIRLWPFEYTCALDEPVNKTVWNIPPVMGIQEPTLLRFFATAQQGRLEKTLTTDTMTLKPGDEMICAPQPCENILSNTGTGLKLQTEFEVKHNCYWDEEYQIGIKVGSMCTASCKLGFEGASQTYTCQTDLKLDVVDGNKMMCQPIFCPTFDILGMAPVNANDLTAHVAPNPGLSVSAYTVGETRYSLLPGKSTLVVGIFAPQQRGSNFMLECVRGWRAYTSAWDVTTQSPLGVKVITPTQPTHVSSPKAPATLPAAPYPMCEQYAFINPYPECRKLQCPPIFVPGGGKVAYTPAVGQTIFFSDEEQFGRTTGPIRIFFHLISKQLHIIYTSKLNTDQIQASTCLQGVQVVMSDNACQHCPIAAW